MELGGVRCSPRIVTMERDRGGGGKREAWRSRNSRCLGVEWGFAVRSSISEYK